MLALGGTCASTMYNETWLKALGVTIPAKPVKWAEYADWATQLQAKLPANTYATTDCGGSNVSYEPYFVQLGMTLYKGEKLNELGYTKEAITDWLNLWEKMRGAKALPPGGDDRGAGQRPTRRFIDGKENRAAPSDEGESTTDLPELHEGRHPGHHAPAARRRWKAVGDWLGTAWQSISSKTKFVDECAAFANWFINDIEPQKIFGAEHGLPGNKKIASQIVPTLNAPTQKGINMVASVADTSWPHPTGPARAPRS